MGYFPHKLPANTGCGDRCKYLLSQKQKKQMQAAWTAGRECDRKNSIREIVGRSMNAINKGYAAQVIRAGLSASMFTILFLAPPAYAQDSDIYSQCPAETGTNLQPNADDVDNLPVGDFPGVGDVDYNGNGKFDTAA
jgi:hypothetical protein